MWRKERPLSKIATKLKDVILSISDLGTDYEYHVSVKPTDQRSDVKKQIR